MRRVWLMKISQTFSFGLFGAHSLHFDDILAQIKGIVSDGFRKGQI